MKKFTFIILLFAIVFNIAACSQNENHKKSDDNRKKDVTVTATPEEIEKKIADAIGKDKYLCTDNIDKEWLQNSYQLDMSKVEAFVAKQSATPSVDTDVVIILKVKEGYANDAVKAFNDNYSQLVSYVRQYPFGTAKVLNGRIYQSGNYVIYAIAGANYSGDNSEEEAKLASDEYAKIDKVIKGIFGTLPKNLAIIPEE